jgi:hypothetical protein
MRAEDADGTIEEKGLATPLRSSDAMLLGRRGCRPTDGPFGDKGRPIRATAASWEAAPDREGGWSHNMPYLFAVRRLG